MKQEIKEATLAAIDKLIEHYNKYLSRGMPPSYGSIHMDCCPLCRVDKDFTDGGCLECPWMLFEKEHCMGNIGDGPHPYEIGTAAERIDRLERWKKLIDADIQNGVVSRRVICVGCDKEFEDLHFVDEEPDSMPVCDKCTETMHP